MLVQAMLTFVGKDHYDKLGTSESLTALLMMTVYADQVKQSTLGHVN